MSTSRSTDTTVLACTKSPAKTSRCLIPPNDTTWPSTQAARGPNTPKRSPADPSIRPPRTGTPPAADTRPFRRDSTRCPPRATPAPTKNGPLGECQRRGNQRNPSAIVSGEIKLLLIHSRVRADWPHEETSGAFPVRFALDAHGAPPEGRIGLWVDLHCQAGGEGASTRTGRRGCREAGVGDQRGSGSGGISTAVPSDWLSNSGKTTAG
jgi:hypothetical protein